VTRFGLTVDAADVLEHKRDALGRHRSQVQPLSQEVFGELP
jgi:LmbE family N-acetylglucosaminyl deacetylase